MCSRNKDRFRFFLFSTGVVNSYIDINVAKVTVTLFHDIIKNLLISQGKHGLPINEDNVTSLFLKLLTLSSSCKSVAKTVKTEQ